LNYILSVSRTMRLFPETSTKILEHVPYNTHLRPLKLRLCAHYCMLIVHNWVAPIYWYQNLLKKYQLVSTVILMELRVWFTNCSIKMLKNHPVSHSEINLHANCLLIRHKTSAPYIFCWNAGIKWKTKFHRSVWFHINACLLFWSICIYTVLLIFSINKQTACWSQRHAISWRHSTLHDHLSQKKLSLPLPPLSASSPSTENYGCDSTDLSHEVELKSRRIFQETEHV
jgi:hypothetical protein